MKLPFDKEILIAVINGLFLLIAAIYGTNTLAKKTQMRKYSEAYVKQEQDLIDELCYVKGMATDWAKLNLNVNDSQFDEVADKSIDLASEYNQKLSKYKILLTEIYLYCGNEISCEFEFIEFIDVQTGKITFASDVKSRDFKF